MCKRLERRRMRRHHKPSGSMAEAQPKLTGYVTPERDGTVNTNPPGCMWQRANG
ncbi:hypothetical protein PS3A_50860 [Pseudomonas sp. 3A(2025)]